MKPSSAYYLGTAGEPTTNLESHSASSMRNFALDHATIRRLLMLSRQSVYTNSLLSCSAATAQCALRPEWMLSPASCLHTHVYTFAGIHTISQASKKYASGRQAPHKQKRWTAGTRAPRRVCNRVATHSKKTKAGARSLLLVHLQAASLV